jgi:hypothetical protein
MSRSKLFYCRTLEDEIKTVVERINPGLPIDGLEYALHNTPQKLKDQLQDKVDSVEEPFDTILLCYGLCSNGVAGLLSPGQKIVIPRIHDCISLLLGSRDEYDRQFRGQPATYYLSRGWISQEGDPLSSYHRYCERYGEKKAKMVIEMEYVNYKRLAYIHTVGDDEEDIRYSREVADFMGVEFVELQGSLRMFEKLVGGDWDNEFVVVSPGQTLEQRVFF